MMSLSRLPRTAAGLRPLFPYSSCVVIPSHFGRRSPPFWWRWFFEVELRFGRPLTITSSPCRLNCRSMGPRAGSSPLHSLRTTPTECSTCRTPPSSPSSTWTSTPPLRALTVRPVHRSRRPTSTRRRRATALPTTLATGTAFGRDVHRVEGLGLESGRTEWAKQNPQGQSQPLNAPGSRASRCPEQYSTTGSRHIRPTRRRLTFPSRTLWTEDLTRGWRIDVLDSDQSSGDWKSLHWRLGQYTIGSDGAVSLAASDADPVEGFVTPGVTHSPGSFDDIEELLVNESIARWDGWKPFHAPSAQQPDQQRRIGRAGVGESGPVNRTHR